MAFKLGRERRGIKNSDTTPIFRKKLDKGILGEANMDGSIYISDKIKPGSAQERKVINHEKKHAQDMASGKLAYTDNDITYMGKKYPRKNGKIKYNGKWSEEGDKSFPWEKAAYKKTKA
jgi:hypothetical protein|tara:strand:+ start:34 stop:390 length:357 start_codon:yes stop_codon:yes gene_type:complete